MNLCLPTCALLRVPTVLSGFLHDPHMHSHTKLNVFLNWRPPQKKKSLAVQKVKILFFLSWSFLILEWGKFQEKTSLFIKTLYSSSLPWFLGIICYIRTLQRHLHTFLCVQCREDQKTIITVLKLKQFIISICNALIQCHFTE